MVAVRLGGLWPIMRGPVSAICLVALPAAVGEVIDDEAEADASQTSLARAVPCWLGKGLRSVRMPGVLAYRPSRPPENAASPAPATAGGMTGSSSAEPSVISAAARSRTKSAGLRFFRNG